MLVDGINFYEFGSWAECEKIRLHYKTLKLCLLRSAHLENMVSTKVW